jgi:4-hydroxybenzoate polyprenyltransferase
MRQQSPAGTAPPWLPAAALLRAAHPGPSAAVTLLAAAYAVSLGLPPDRVALVTGAVLAGQLSIGWCNDVVDADRDRAVGRGDKPLATGELSVTVARAACAVALAATVVLSLACGLVAGLVHLACVAAGWAYDLGVKATAWSWAPYAVAFGGLPVFVSLAGTGLPPAVSVPVAGALLGVGAHLLNVLPDLADDEATGVRGLGHRLGPRRARVAAVVALAAATLVLAVGTPGIPTGWRAAAVLAVAVLAVPALRAEGRTPFRAAIGIAAVDVLLLVVTA